MKNPYAWNRINLDLVYGRSSLLNEMLSGLPAVPPVSYALTGGRRIGKTTVLRAIEAELIASQPTWSTQDLAVIPIYIDGLTLPRPLTADCIWGRLHAQLSSALQRNAGPASITMAFEDFVSSTRRLFSGSPKAIKAIVLFDEVEPILINDWADSFCSHWRALLSNVPGLSSSFAAVFSGAHELVRLRQDIGSPLMDVLELRGLTNLSEQYARKLMEEPVGSRWDESFYVYVFDQTGGHPMLLQYVMQAVCARPEGVSPLDAAEHACRTFLDTRGWQLADWWYKHCSSSAQAIYTRLPADFAWMPLSGLTHEFGTRVANDAVQLLVHVGIATSSDDGLQFRRAGRLFATWQGAHGTALPSSVHDPLIFQRLTRVDSELAQKYLTSWRILNAELPNYSGAVSEMRDTITLALHHYAPDEQVMAETGFVTEPGQTKPTRRQRARFAANRMQLSKEQRKSLIGDVDTLEFYGDQFAQAVANAYGIASSLTHTTSTRELAYLALKQGDTILAQLLT